MVGSLEKIYGAITFYLGNKEVVEAYSREQDSLLDRLAAEQKPIPDAFGDKIERMRHSVASRS